MKKHKHKEHCTDCDGLLFRRLKHLIYSYMFENNLTEMKAYNPDDNDVRFTMRLEPGQDEKGQFLKVELKMENPN